MFIECRAIAQMSRSLKTVLVLVVVLLTTAAALWIIGSQRARYSTSLMIEAAPARVFSHLTDAELMKQWVDGLVDVQPINDLPNQVGAKTRIVMKSAGKTIELDDEVIRYEENELLSVKANNRTMTLVSIYRLKPTEEGNTYLTMVVKKSHQGIGKFMAPFMSSSLQEKITSDAQRLKSLVESNPAASQLNAVTPQSTPAQTFTSDSTPTQ